MNDLRYQRYLLERYRAIGRHVGFLFCLIGILILLPTGLLICYPEELPLLPGFVWPGLGLLFLGLVLKKILPRRADEVLSLPEAAVIIVLAWLAAIAAGAIPFRYAGVDWTRAVFEATSGWTTTGLSVLDTPTTSHLLLFYRSLMQLAGGAGLAIIILSAMVGPAGVGLAAAEGRAEQILPQVKQSARLVLKLYSVYVSAGVIMLKLAGMAWFDAVNHAFCALSTGGFSTRDNSVAFWNNPAIEAVLMLLMLLGAMSFLTGHTLWHGQWRKVTRNGEIRVMACLIPFSIAALLLGAAFQAYQGENTAIRAAIFTTITALSTTGYTTVSPTDLSSFGWLIVIILMLIGGSSGSTAGGIKLHRLFLLFKGIKRELGEVFLPRNTVYEETIWAGTHHFSISETAFRKAALYVALYLFCWLVGGLAIAALGYPVADSLFEFASALGTVGLSAGITGPYAPDGLLWILIMGMVLGRLEFFVIFWGIIKIGKDLPELCIKKNRDI